MWWGKKCNPIKKISAPETVSVQNEHLQSVISSTDGAKVLKEIDPAIEGYENPTEIQIILSRVADKNIENKKPAAIGCRFFIEEYLIQKVLKGRLLAYLRD